MRDTARRADYALLFALIGERQWIVKANAASLGVYALPIRALRFDVTARSRVLLAPDLCTPCPPLPQLLFVRI